MPVLYVVATPIGNLEDITLRALRVLKEVGLIAAEDTRVSRRLLERYSISTPVTSFHEHTRIEKITYLMEELAVKDVALISDAGMPGVNDPGPELVRAAISAGYSVVPVPGPSALTAALAVSGLVFDQFRYLGFLPKRKKERRELLQSFRQQGYALVALESPTRIRASLEDIADILGQRHMAICREMTKIHEEVFRGTASEALEYFSTPKGEFTIVIEGPSEEILNDGSISDESAVRKRLEELKASGARARDAVAQVALQYHLPKRQAYRMWLELAGKHM